MSALNANQDGPGTSGLLLYASYPGEDMSASPLPVLSISGSQDGLATPAKIEASAPLLPASTQFVQIEGACHSQFGDYGPQNGDQQPTISAAAAQGQITEASLAFVAEVNALG